MAEPPPSEEVPPASVLLLVRKLIRATPERLFDAWTTPEQLRQWWGPESVTCLDARIDLTVGGQYRIANQFPDGTVLWISGEFEAIERPHKLVYTWRIAPEAGAERVIVNFEPKGDGTEVTVTHERIPNAAMRDLHRLGWVGCLEGLAEFLTAGGP